MTVGPYRRCIFFWILFFGLSIKESNGEILDVLPYDNTPRLREESSIVSTCLVDKNPPTSVLGYKSWRY